MIKKDMTLGEIVSKYPSSVNIFKSKNISGFDENSKSALLNKLTLEMAAKTKKINLEILLDTLNSSFDTYDADITAETREYKAGGTDVSGLLPCPVRLPLLEAFKEFDSDNPEIKLNYDLKSASSGSGWMEELIKKDNISEIPDIFISTGFELFFSQNLKNRIKKESAFKDKTGLEKYNKIFDNTDLKDPYGNYAMVGVVPAVMLVNPAELKGRKCPKTWEDILKPEFEKSISIPMGDLDLYNAALITLHSRFGYDGIKKLKNNFLDNLHPSQMIKADKLKVNKPAITITPYFFTKMLPEKSEMFVNWPKDGAIVSPIFMLIKNRKSVHLDKTVNFLSSKKTGEILSKQGYFPSVHPDVENNIKDKKFLWAGWDYLYENDIDQILDNCTKILTENTQEV
ncbi:ABC transporter substrate-binding protein [Sebaldella sp. S0638]|uniref:ABC transporter substrate-binding protein n=1 Tax=Sebaldella sp. S0638 TaxID=2957809 RepID=UPI00209E6789|nr:ABC transporter substrate-binding protein [Sebaldella sp. S0638]MCP1222902.1 ABC transporter substrate-binding protein [Sebaldella sp. S0638]